MFPDALQMLSKLSFTWVEAKRSGARPGFGTWWALFSNFVLSLLLMIGLAVSLVCGLLFAFNLIVLLDLIIFDTFPHAFEIFNP